MKLISLVKIELLLIIFPIIYFTNSLINLLMSILQSEQQIKNIILEII